MRRSLGLIASLDLVFTILPAVLLAQGTGSAVTGQVRDSSQAVVAGATVSVTNVETGVSRSTETDSQGRYRAGELLPGSYQVTVTMAGFSKTRKDLTLAVGQEASLNLVLQVGAVEQEVVVTGTAPVIETTTATVSAAVTQEQLRELPLNGRSFTDLITLQAGAIAPANAQSTGVGAMNFGNGPQLSIAGARTDANNFMLDGTDMNGTVNGTPGSAARVQLGVDTVREYQVITSNAKAEHGRNAGGTINAVTRSGTNDWHGSAFEFLRNSKLDARNFFDRNRVPPFKRNQFGAIFGGRLRRDKSFFFLGFEGLRERLNQSTIWNVPTREARLGAGVLQAGDAVNPRVVPFLNLYPLPNGANLGSGIAEFLEDISQPTEENFGSARVDHNFSSKDFLFARYTTSRGEAERVATLRSNSILHTANQYFTVQEDHIFSAALLNTFRVGYNRSVNDFGSGDVPEAPVSLGFVEGRRMGQLNVGGLSLLGPTQTSLIFHVQNIFQYEDNLTYTRGAHTMKFGAMAERFQWNTDVPAQIQGSYGFSNLRNFLLAGPTGSTATVLLPFSSSYRHMRTTLLAFFAQDDYRVSSRLTVNLGLRWEFTTGLTENDNLLVYMRRGPLLSDAGDLARGALWNNHKRNLEPRIGFNWAMDAENKTVLSGGFGVFHNEVLNNSFISYRVQLPIYFRGSATNADVSQTFPNIVSSVAAFATGFRATETRHFDFDNFRTPTFYRYNLTVQRQLPGSLALRVGYLGATGFHMQREQQLNRFPQPVRQADGSLFFPPAPVAQFINPNFGSIFFMGSDSNSVYSALAVNMEKRFSQGITFQASYTYSQCVDDMSNSETNFEGGGRSGQFAFDRALDRSRCAFNVPHVFVGNWLYELPFGSGRRWLNSGIARAIAGDWQIGGILSLQQGTSFSPLSNVLYPGFQFVASRPNLKPGVNVGEITGGPRDRYFDPAAFSLPAAGAIGNAGRNIMLGPSLQNVNFTLSKTFPLGERPRLQFRSEFFNLLNRANFANPQNTVFTSTTGSINPSAGRIVRTATTSRQIQFGLKLTF